MTLALGIFILVVLFSSSSSYLGLVETLGLGRVTVVFLGVSFTTTSSS